LNPHNLWKLFLILALFGFALGLYSLSKYLMAEHPDNFHIIGATVNFIIAGYLYARSRMIKNSLGGFKTWRSYEK